MDSPAPSPPKEAFGPPDHAGVPRRGPLPDLVGKWWFWLVFMLLLFGVIIGRTVTRDPPVVPKALFSLPAWKLTDERGQPFGTEQLHGKVWVANFIFTSCPSICPELSQKMKYLQARTRHAANHVHLVSFTVDPEVDTPEKLADYGKAHTYNPRRWTFVTGDTKTVEDFIVKGFKLAMGKEGPDLTQVFHSERFVLVDRAGNVRGFYEANDEGMKRLLTDIGTVLNRT